MDKGEVTAITLFDLSAAFDTIDYATLTDSDWYGISGQAQIWFSSYLHILIGPNSNTSPQNLVYENVL